MPSGKEAHAVAEEMYAVAFEARHECVVGRVSREFPELRIAHWCVPTRAVFQVSGPEDELDSFEGWLRKDAGILHRSAAPESRLFVTKRCCAMLAGRSVTSVIQAAGAWDIPPIVYHEGWETWRVLVWGERSLKDFLQGLRETGEFRILSLRRIEDVDMEKTMLIPASDLFGGLTDRQILALSLGLERGHYSQPSRANAEKLAREAGISPSTFSEHLRKAEARVLLNLQPHLKAFSLRRQGEPSFASFHEVHRGHPLEAIPAFVTRKSGVRSARAL